MLVITRRSQIKEILLARKSITVSELSKMFSVTEETIRRDLQQLENSGFLTRTYGGAFIQDGALSEVDFVLSETEHLESKEAIASKCMEFIHQDDIIFLDASATATFIAKKLRSMRLTVVTNSLMVMDQLKDCDSIHLICVGGTFFPNSKSFHGSTTTNNLKNYFVDKIFISCSSLSLEHGIMDTSEESASLRQLLLKSGNTIYLIADKSKFNKTSFVYICDYTPIHALISDFHFTPRWIEVLKNNCVRIYSCK